MSDISVGGAERRVSQLFAITTGCGRVGHFQLFSTPVVPLIAADICALLVGDEIVQIPLTPGILEGHAGVTVGIVAVANHRRSNTLRVATKPGLKAEIP